MRSQTQSMVERGKGAKGSDDSASEFPQALPRHKERSGKNTRRHPALSGLRTDTPGQTQAGGGEDPRALALKGARGISLPMTQGPSTTSALPAASTAPSVPFCVLAAPRSPAICCEWLLHHISPSAAVNISTEKTRPELGHI